MQYDAVAAGTQKIFQIENKLKIPTPDQALHLINYLMKYLKLNTEE